MKNSCPRAGICGNGSIPKASTDEFRSLCLAPLSAAHSPHLRCSCMEGCFMQIDEKFYAIHCLSSPLRQMIHLRHIYILLNGLRQMHFTTRYEEKVYPEDMTTVACE